MIEKIGTKRNLWLSMILYLVCASVLMPYGARTTEEKAGKKVPILDLQYRYSSAEGKAILAQYNPEARHFAASFNRIADTIYPLVYMSFLTVSLAFLFRSLSAGKTQRLQFLIAMPLLAGMFDFLENGNIQLILTRYPVVSDQLVEQTSVYTQWKWNFALVSVGLVIIGWIAFFLQRRSKNTPR